MEISNRALGIVSATLILLGISMRVQSGPTSGSSDSSGNLGNVQAKPIPNSDFNALTQAQTIRQLPVETKLGGTPNKDLIHLNQAGAIVPGVTKVEDDSAPAVVTPPSDEEQQQAQADAYMQGYSDSAVNNGSVITPTGNATVDAVVGSLEPEDQAGFGMMWAGISADQRERILGNIGR